MRRVAVSVVLAIAVVGAALVALPGTARPQARCATGTALDWVLPGACQHVDEAPPGVDVTRAVPTRELLAREGGGAAAYEAAEDLGVPAPAQAAATSPVVPCDGDGTSGYRTQAMYVVEAGRTNRFAALESSIRLWAAGVDDVVNRSAALTGGIRHVRYVTDPSGSDCVADVINVTVPAGATSSFGATVSAVQALGYTAPNRKYLMWTDATVLCGVATVYPTDTDGQGNPNNGAYAQYARVDSGCWGFGDGASQHSVEAHELVHTFGSVMSTAPHGTRAGHCYDESDTMCYADGGGFAMQQVCPPQREYLLDCNNDDYYSTYPDPGSWLDTHWNAADSRFLIGGGDGSGGGSLGTPTTLGATIAVNNPAVPGLRTQASVTPSIPAGRTLTSVRWTSARSDCAFTGPTSAQTEVACNATATGSTTVTAVLTDSTGATRTVSSPLTFATGTARAVTLALGAAGQSPASGGTAGVCVGAAFPLTARVVDVASGQPVKGLATALTKQTATTTVASAGAPVTNASGVATQSQTATVSTTYTGRTSAGAVFAAAPTTSLVAVPARCTTALSAAMSPGDGASVYYGDAVTVSGSLSATAAGATVVPAGVSLALRLTTPAGTAYNLGSTKTGLDGTFTAVIKPTVSGTIAVSLAGTTAYAASSAAVGAVSVLTPATLITGAVSPTDVGYGQTVRVTGTLQRDAGGTITGLGGRAVAVWVTPSGAKAVKVGAGTTRTDGGFTVDLPLKYSGLLSVVYAGATGQPAATDEVTQVVAGTWTTAVTGSASASRVVAGTAVTLSGAVTRSYGGSTVAAPGLRVAVYFTAAGTSTPTLVTTVTTNAAGGYSARVTARVSGTWRLVVPTAPGYTTSSSSDLTVTVG